MSAPPDHSKPSAWDKTKHGSKAAFDKGWSWFEKAGVPVNKLTNKIGSEAFWPSTLGNEADKSARILKSFCKDGFYKEQPNLSGTQSPGPKNKPKVLVKIPQKVIQKCVGLAIFTVMRTGLWVSGAGGSGVLIARKEDGSWSPPSGILVHTLGVGFMAGIDIYDCVVVINNREALNAFSKLRVSLGGEVSVVAGPVGIGGNVEGEILKDRKPVWSYIKSRGLYGGIQFDGTIIIERNDENARFYGERLPVGEILKGNVRMVPPETRLLMEVLKQAEGRTDVDDAYLANLHHQPTPGDFEVENMSEPTEEQKSNYGPPQGFYGPEKTGYEQPHDQAGAVPPEGSNPAHPAHGGYQPSDYPPPPQPPRPSSTSYDPNHPQQGSYAPSQGQGASAPQGSPPQGASSQAPYFPPPPTGPH